MSVQSPIVLEPSAQGIVDATSTHPFLYELEPAAARKVLDDLQAAPIDKLPIEEEWITVPAAVGDVRVRIIRPVDSPGVLPVIVYMHGGGWILGNAGTHDRLVRELAVGARAALLFVEYPNSPGGALSGRDRAGLCHRPVGDPRRRDAKGLDAEPHGRCRRVGRR